MKILPDEPANLLRERYTTETLKLPAVLLGIASAAIGFAFHETADRALDGPTIIALSAIGLWALSFASGVLFSQSFTLGIKANIGEIEAQKMGYPEGVEMAKEMFANQRTKSTRFYRWQQYFLLAGALAYLAAHVWRLNQLDVTTDNDRWAIVNLGEGVTEILDKQSGEVLRCGAQGCLVQEVWEEVLEPSTDPNSGDPSDISTPSAGSTIDD